MVDKVIVSNAEAFTKKYSKSGFSLVKSSLKDLITADAERGLENGVVFIDDASAMRRLGDGCSPDPADERGAKRAVDAICSTLAPDYIVLLDGPDIVPHIVLRNRVRERSTCTQRFTLCIKWWILSRDISLPKSNTGCGANSQRARR